MLWEDVDVREVADDVAIGDYPGEADLRTVVVEADDPRRSPHEILHDLARPSPRPIRLFRQIAVDGVEVDTRKVVVQLVPVRQLSPHRAPR